MTPTLQAFPHRFRCALFSHRPARGTEPASRHFHPHRDRDDARRGESEFHRILAFRSAAASANRRDGRDFLHRDRRGRSRCRPGDGHRGLPALPDHERRSTRPAQRMNPLDRTANLWLIPAVPSCGSARCILSLAKSRRKSAAACSQSAARSLRWHSRSSAFLPTLQAHGFRAVQNFTWFTFGEQALRSDLFSIRSPQ